MYRERKRNIVGQRFRGWGDFVSIVGRDEAVMREYIKTQEKEALLRRLSVCVG